MRGGDHGDSSIARRKIVFHTLFWVVSHSARKVSCVTMPLFH